jgi:hypothetical protein
MILPRSLLVLATAAALPGIVGCGLKPPAPNGKSGEAKKGSPQAAFIKARDALRAMDFGSLHDMLSEDAKASVNKEVTSTVSSAAEVGSLACELLGIDPAKLSDLSARDKYARIMEIAYETNAKLESALRSGKSKTGLAASEFASAKTNGDRATVTVKLASGAAEVIMLIQEGGIWKLVEPFAPQKSESSKPTPDKARSSEAPQPTK